MGVALPPRGCGGGVSPHKKRKGGIAGPSGHGGRGRGPATTFAGVSPPRRGSFFPAYPPIFTPFLRGELLKTRIFAILTS